MASLFRCAAQRPPPPPPPPHLQMPRVAHKYPMIVTGWGQGRGLDRPRIVGRESDRPNLVGVAQPRRDARRSPWSPGSTRDRDALPGTTRRWSRPSGRCAEGRCERCTASRRPGIGSRHPAYPGRPTGSAWTPTPSAASANARSTPVAPSWNHLAEATDLAGIPGRLVAGTAGGVQATGTP